MTKLILIINHSNSGSFIYGHEFYETEEQLKWMLKGITLVGSDVSYICYDLIKNKFEDDEDYFECFNNAKEYMKDRGII